MHVYLHVIKTAQGLPVLFICLRIMLVQVSSNAMSSQKIPRHRLFMYMYICVGQMHVHGQYRQFVCKHYALNMYINLSSKERRVTVSVLLRLNSPHLPIMAWQVAHVNLVFLCARSCDSAYGPALQRCLLVIHIIVTHSRTVVHVHVMYYMSNADGTPSEKVASRTAVYIASQLLIMFDLCT